MDQSQNGAYGGTQSEPTGRHSLQKQRSLVGVRSGSVDKQPRPLTTTTVRTDRTVSQHAGHVSNGKANGPGQRKGSLRNVVRRIFGRSGSSRLVTPAQQHTTPARHAYHRSEPHGLPAPQEGQNDDQEEVVRLPQRALSTPLHIDVPAISGTKVRSPYAVEFPKSARLKPLDISSPFDAPGAPLRRRKTLPSILIAGDDATAIAAAAKSSEAPPVPTRSSAEIIRQTPTSEIGLAISGVTDKRRSRSAAGMRTRDSGVASEPERKRSEEIGFWRESYQGSVIRASGFTVPFSVPPPEEQERDDKWQTNTEQLHEPSSSAGHLEDSPQGARVASHSRQDTLGTLDGSTQLGFRSTSGLSRDLEDRVAQLEANLQLFQRSLHKLQADRNRRTVIVGDYPSVDHDNSYRTPSMLADNLHVPDGCMDEDSPEQPKRLRPVTAPQPRSPIAEDPPVPPLPGQSDNYSPDLSQSAIRPDSTRRPSNLIISNPNVTFKSLYQMLTDERSARRRLESQMRTLHIDIQELQLQVSSNSYSHRNSYMLSHEATVASSRLRDLLRETESDGGCSPEDTPRKQVYVSRFSGSTTAGVHEVDDEEDGQGGAYDEGDEAQTPYEEYKTPKEEQSPFRFEPDGEMF